MNRINEVFARLKEEGRKALITFITAGDPSLEKTSAMVMAMAENGADIIELGVPFSDPLADGPTIQAASMRAIHQGTTLKEIIAMVKDIRSRCATPLVLMSYYNPIMAYGVSDFVADAAAVGVNGVIIPDLPPEEGEQLRQEAEAKEVALIQLVAPTSTPERIARLCRLSRGFVYYVMVTGITGTRRKLPPAIPESLKQLKNLTKTPIAAGFGISTPEQAAEVGQYADGVIVGSALVKIVAEHGAELDLPERLGSFVHQLRFGLDGGLIEKEV
ncbi:MAG: tryptophan synthase subunit alpha [Pseudomonadota bacterium]|nr:tryptophan synthase subunit alpha [Pseudomonadota bacterium]